MLVVGCGGPTGWVDFEVSKRAPNKDMPENPKDDMSNMIIYYSTYFIRKQYLYLAQCENFSVFLSYRFYVKSLLENLKILSSGFFELIKI